MAIRMVRQPVLQAYTMSTSPGVVFTTATRYWPVSGTAESTAITAADFDFPIVGTITGAEVSLQAAPGSGNTLTLTLFKNGSSTGITVTISGASARTGSVSATVTGTLGDRFCWQSTGTGATSVRGGAILYISHTTQ